MSMQSNGYLNVAQSELNFDITDININEHSACNMTYNCFLCNAMFWERAKLSTSTNESIKVSICCVDERLGCSSYIRYISASC